MHEVALTAFRFETNAGAARLERFAVGAGRNIQGLGGRRNPRLDVVWFRGSEAQIASTQLHHAIMNAELLENRFRVANKRFELAITVFRPCELEEFDLLKLMLAFDAPGVSSGGACFGAKAGGPSAHLDRQGVGLYGVAPLKVHHLRLCRGGQPKIRSLQPKHIFGEFWELTVGHE